MYTPSTRTELMDILSELQTYAEFERLSAVSEILADARLSLAMEDRRGAAHILQARLDRSVEWDGKI